MRCATVIVGDVLAHLPGLSGFDACLCDPPYGLEFMGQAWDAPWKRSGTVLKDPASVGGFQDGAGGNPYSRSRVRIGRGPGFQQWCESWAALVLAALKPGAMHMAFGGTRMYHRLACGIEDAGFEIRDTLCWLYGSGFPKSHDISKGIDKAAGAERERFPNELAAQQTASQGTNSYSDYAHVTHVEPVPATEAACQWDGYGTALKPAWEPITLAMKPLSGTFAANALEHGVAGLNVDGGRISGALESRRVAASGSRGSALSGSVDGSLRKEWNYDGSKSRWPANVLLDEEAATALDEQSDTHSAGHARPEPGGGSYDGTTGIGMGIGIGTKGFRIGDSGGASRFFYTAKAAPEERKIGGIDCTHPTLKPIDLTAYLAKLLLPPERDTPRRLLVPFSGAGSEIIGALRAGWDEVVGIELDPAYAEMSTARIKGDAPLLNQVTGS